MARDLDDQHDHGQVAQHDHLLVFLMVTHDHWNGMVARSFLS